MYLLLAVAYLARGLALSARELSPLRGVTCDQLAAQAMIDALSIAEANLLDLLRTTGILEEHVVFVHLRTAMGQFAGRAHGRVLVVNAIVLGTTGGTVLLGHVDVAVSEATFQHHRPTLSIVVALSWAQIAAAVLSTHDCFLAWYQLITLM